MSDLSQKQSVIRPIDPNVLQRKAATPSQSVWVGASAGSGKTKVLVDRIIRLLLPDKDGRKGARPYKILALTFTKAAASEMRLRIQETLGEWAIMPIVKMADNKKYLTKELEDILGHKPTQKQIDEAKALFNKVIDTPGGINIMTIHSFCQSILGRFPLEAGLKPNFVSLEEAQAAIIVEKSKLSLFSKSDEEKTSRLTEAVNIFTNFLNEDQFSTLLNEIVRERKQIENIFSNNFSQNDFYSVLCESMDIATNQTSNSIIENFCNKDNIPENDLYQAIQALCESKSKPDQERGYNIKRWIEQTHQGRINNIDDYLSIYLTDKDKLRKKLAVNAVFDNNQSVEEILNQEALRALELNETVKKYNVVENTNYFLILSKHFLEIYKNEKNRQNALDYDDLIINTNNLLNGNTEALSQLEGTTSWIRYKMDQGIDHILVDEAQDTNPEQWEIIKSLTDDFFSHLDNEEYRSLFVVGDEKQSIYSFQRASPEKFDEMRKFYDKKINSSLHQFEEIDFITSFRSAPAILSFIDSVYADQQLKQGLGHKNIEHQSYRRGQLGQVTLWPLFEDDEKTVVDPWDPPTEIINYASGSSKMADYIGDTIKGWIDDKRQLYSYNRPIEAGDVLILLRSRNKFLDQLVRALKIRDIPVSGVDRLVLNDHLAVQDLMAAAQFVLLPEDDLNLAGLLKSPFIGLSEEELFDLSYKRAASLWQSVKDNNNIVSQWLCSLIYNSKYQNPYEFFSSLLNLPCPKDSISGLRALRGRLSDEILDPVEEFLSLSLSASKDHSLSLQAFIQEQMNNQSQIKREMEEGSDKVRIMTVHGAKGLQSPIVILPDTTRNSASVKTDKILWPQKTGAHLPYYCASTKEVPEQCKNLIQTIQDKNDEEYRRLFYVAATRAESELYIGGYKGSKNILEDSWYNYSLKTINTMPNILKTECPVTNQEIFTHFNKEIDPPDYAHKKSKTAFLKKPNLPKWMFVEIRNTDLPIEIYRPSEGLKDEVFLSPFKDKENDRFKRGNIIHSLLQILPDLQEQERKETAQNYLKRPIHNLNLAEQQKILKEIINLLEDSNFKDIFSPNAQAEVAITGKLGKKLVSGKIDRLLVTDKEVLIIDFKTNRPPPHNITDVPQAYIDQLNSYEAILKGIYPNHIFKKALLWTNDARLMEL